MTIEPVTVDLFVRSLSPVGARGRPTGTIERLRDLVETGRIERYSVYVTGEEVEISSDAPAHERGEFILDRVAAFRSWAAERGVTLDAFDRREVSTLTGERYTVLALPVMALAESVGGDLACVAPCSTDDGVVTVADRLESLERDDGHGPRDDRDTRSEERTGRLRGHDAVRS